MNLNNLNLYGTPSGDEIGEHEISISVQDEVNTISQNFTLNGDLRPQYTYTVQSLTSNVRHGLQYND